MKHIIFEARARHKRYFDKHCKEDQLTYVKEPLTEKNAKAYKDAEIISVFVFSKVSSKVIEQLPKLKIILARSTGFDHISLSAAKKRGIPVCNVPRYGSNTVAEHTFALILNLSRNVHKSYMRTMNDNFKIEDLTGFDLKGKTLGVIGAGRIGQHVIKIAKGFGMHVIAYDAYRNNFLADLLHFTYADTVEDVLKKADIVTLHAPATPETHHLIDKERLKLMKRGALLINTSRGELVDTNALYDALESKRLGGAGLDVIEGEKIVKEDQALLREYDKEQLQTAIRDKAILRMDNVIFTPHNAFNSKEALERIMDVTNENINAYKKDKPQNVVNT